jgi:hypothetical protein
MSDNSTLELTDDNGTTCIESTVSSLEDDKNTETPSVKIEQPIDIKLEPVSNVSDTQTIPKVKSEEEETVEENVKTSAEQSIEEAYQSANSNYVTPIRPTRPLNMNATFSSGRGKNCPAVKDKV